MTCPCGSGRSLETCCAPYLRNLREPPDCEALMRSRFTAFALGDVEHLVRTLHPEHPDLAQGPKALRETLRKSREGTRYKALTVLDREGPDALGVGRVLFYAEILRRGRDVSFHELSSFAHDGTGWRYLAGRARSGKPAAGLTIADFEAP